MEQSYPLRKTRYTKEMNEKDYYYHLCPTYPDQFRPTLIRPVERIVVIGDIKGNLKNGINALIKAGVISVDADFDIENVSFINQYMKWIGGNTIVVQLGDQNGGFSDMEVMALFDHVGAIARLQGGDVYSLIGDGEISTIISRNPKSDTEYLYYDVNGDKYYRGNQGRGESWRVGGPVAKHIACTRQSVLVIGSNIFIHSNLTPKILNHISHDKTMTSYEKLIHFNTVVREWLINIYGKDSKMKKFMDPLLKKDTSPWFDDYYSNIPDYDMSPSCAPEENIRKLFGYRVDRIIIANVSNNKRKNIDDGSEGIYGKCGYGSLDSSHVIEVDLGLNENPNHVKILEIIDDIHVRVIR